MHTENPNLLNYEFNGFNTKTLFIKQNIEMTGKKNKVNKNHLQVRSEINKNHTTHR